MIRKISLRRGISVLASALVVGVLFTACKKDNDDLAPNPVAALMAFNLVPDQQAVDIALSGNLIGNAPLAYTSYTGRYINVFPGNRIVESYSVAANKTLDSLAFTFEADKYYSLFVVGANDTYKNIVVEDNYDSLTASSGKAYIRYINAVADASAATVAIRAEGSDVVNEDAAFGEVSEFVAVTPGPLDINLTNEGSVNASRNITVEQHKAYTVLLAGIPNHADSAKAVQIRFVENGTVTD